MGSLEVQPPSERFGAAVIVGVDPARDVDDPAARDLVRGALAEHGVACLRLRQKLDRDAFRRVAQMFGPIKNRIGRTKSGAVMQYDPEMQVMDAGYVLTEEKRARLGNVSFGGDAQRPGLFETFHVDDTYTEMPAAATVLHAQELPPSGGGDTCFLDMRAAYDLLDEEMRRRLQGLRAVYAHNNRGAFAPRVSASGPNDALIDVDHPIVRTHPITKRRALFLDLDRATHVEGLAIAEGRALLRSLQERAEQRAPIYRHRWHGHDVLAWDNASVQHKASGDFPVGEPRRFFRFLIAGTKPE